MGPATDIAFWSCGCKSATSVLPILTSFPLCRWGLLYVPPGFGCISASRLPPTQSSYVSSYSMLHSDTVGALCRGFILPRFVCPCYGRDEIILFLRIDYATLCACQGRIALNCVSGLKPVKGIARHFLFIVRIGRLILLWER